MSLFFRTSVFIRTCQECGNSQPATEPRGTPTCAYLNATCRRCHSPGLDFGHHRGPLGWSQIDAGLEQTL